LVICLISLLISRVLGLLEIWDKSITIVGNLIWGFRLTLI
jgi:hypothetical protein